MTAPAPTLYEAVGAERSARLGRPAALGERSALPAPIGAPAAIGPWASFLAAFDGLLEANRTGDAAQADALRTELADLRAHLALGGVAMPTVSRRVRPEPAVDRRRLPAADAR